MNTRTLLIAASGVALVGAAAWLLRSDRAERPVDAALTVPSVAELLATARTATSLQRIEYTVSAPLRDGELRLYRLVDGEVSAMERVPLPHVPFRGYVEYPAPVDAAGSVLLAHVVASPAAGAAEYVCFAPVANDGGRHAVELNCDMASTVTYYMSASRVGTSFGSPFFDAPDRISLWSDLHAARRSDLVEFLCSAFGTAQSALLRIGRERFVVDQHSIRPVMETLVARSLERFRRTGSLSAADIVEFANAITGSELPLARLVRFPDVYRAARHLEVGDGWSTTEVLVRRTKTLAPPSLQAELDRFFLEGAPLEMTDARTYVVQSVRHRSLAAGLELQWDALPHVYGYNVYADDVLVASTRRTSALVPTNVAVATVRAVGQSGEFDGARHPLSAPLTAAVAAP
jgi:hypothetical protein